MAVVFFSYSHRDEELRNELQTHLAPLQREGLLESWHDRRIEAGDEIHGKISQNLERADIILLLVSPHFLESNYCYDVEMKRAMERHAEGTARVIPVILQPCDWHSSQFGSLNAVPADGKPIAKFPNVHDGLLQVAQAIRRIVGQTRTASAPKTQVQIPTPQASSRLPPVQAEARSSNLRVRKLFSDQDRDRFLEDTFEYIAAYFETSAAELQQRNPEVSAVFKRVDSNRFTVFVYRNGKSVCECSVRVGDFLGKGITYSTDANSVNSMNEGVTVINDGIAMFLKPTGIGSYSGGKSNSLTQEGAAELFWGTLMRPLQQ